MGAAMAPAALSTLVTHFEDTGRQPNYYDAIITGDLGYVGKDILLDLANAKGYDISSNYDDCGVLMFVLVEVDVHVVQQYFLDICIIKCLRGKLKNYY